MSDNFAAPGEIKCFNEELAPMIVLAFICDRFHRQFMPVLAVENKMNALLVLEADGFKWINSWMLKPRKSRKKYR